MTEDEILAQLVLVNQAISDILQAGQEYEVGSGPSRRRTEMPDLDKLYKQRAGLLLDLDSLNGGGSFPLSF